ncbi:hypothetical protein EWH08_18705 [Sphingobium indicum]|uniref:TnsA endonuclease N-terminal domain-containing protein n=1 Tax=Sphingobium indicum TaxID=332055 RepID=A0A4Q4IV51_9SPHN|nr:hypothetical protein [Sphingobium indicum]NYI24822.1 hypothetical protein [Sphingobium indicum]RYL97443.1 hypothetical protein EWH08_18705 [Sphingobium indicum]
MTDKSARLRSDATVRFARNPAERPGRKSCTGWYQSIKAGDGLPYESLLERDALLLLDFDRDVAHFSVQPETFVWTEAGRQRRYTPDIRLEMADGKIIYRQVKLATRLAADPTLGGRLPAIEAECAARGGRHEMWLDTDIRRQPRLSNVRRLRAAVAVLAAENLPAIRTIITHLPFPLTLGATAAALGGQAVHTNVVLGLVAIGDLVADLDRPLDENAILMPGTGR